MAVPKKKRAEAQRLGTEVRDAVLANVGELLDEHMAEILNVIEESETGKLSVGFPTGLDFSESEPSVQTFIRFATTVTDKRVKKLENPDQLRLFTPRPGAEVPAANDDEQSEAEEQEQDAKSRKRTLKKEAKDAKPAGKKRGRKSNAEKAAAAAAENGEQSATA